MANAKYQYTAGPRLFFDLETHANPTMFEMIKAAVPPKNYTDPAKIIQFMEDARQEAIDKAPLDPDYGKIVSLGFALGPQEPITTLLVGEEVRTEADLLVEFWRQFVECNGRCVGYNILAFDLPYLLARSMYNNVTVSLIPNLAKFRVEPITDLFAIRYNWSYGKSLKLVCKMLEIENRCPEADGSKVKDMTPEEIRAYQENDVRLIIDLFKRMNDIYFVL